MTKDNFPMCEFKKRPCENFYSCKYLKERFGAFECMTARDKKQIVDEVHKKELIKRMSIIGHN